MPDPGRLYLDQDFAILWTVELDRLDLEGLSCLESDCSARLHDGLPSSDRCGENGAGSRLACAYLSHSTCCRQAPEVREAQKQAASAPEPCSPSGAAAPI